MDPTESLLNAWRANPEAQRAGALCRVLGSRAGESPEHRRVLTEVAPQIMSRHGRDLAVQLDLARACIAAGDMFLSDTVLKPLLQIAPNDPNVWRLLGEVFLRAGNAKDAETAFEGAIARGLRDTDTMRWHEKARGCRNLQDSGGHPAVAAEVLRWTESWGRGGPAGGGTGRLVEAPGYDGAASGPKPRLVDSPDSQRTVIREPPPSDLDATIVREPHAADLALSDKIPDSDRTAFYKKPDVPAARPPAPLPAPPAPNAPYPAAPPLAVAAPLPRVVAPPRIADTQPQAAAEDEPTANKGVFDEESMDIDVLKLPEGDKLDEVLEALRKSEGLVIEDPTGFYQVPQGLLPPEEPTPNAGPKGATDPLPADILALARAGKLPNTSGLGGTMMMPPTLPTTQQMPAGLGSPPAPPPPAFPPPPPPASEAPTGPGRRIDPGIPRQIQPGHDPRFASVESPSGVIINAPGNEADAMAPTARPSNFMYGPDSPPGMLVAGPPPHLLAPGAPPPLPLGPGPAATTVRPPKGKSRTGLVVAILLVLALGGGAYYAIRVRGLITIGAAPGAAHDARNRG